MIVEFDHELRLFAEEVGRERYRQNRSTWQINFNRSSESKDYLDIIGAYGEVAVVVGFGLDVKQIVWDKPGRDARGVDFVLPSGKTLQVKTPIEPNRDFKVPGTEKTKFGDADYAVLVDCYYPRAARIFGWLSREEFMEKAEWFSFLPNPCYGVYRVNLHLIDNIVPSWVNKC